MALTRITQGVIKPNENYNTHNINSTGIITATGANISGNMSVGGVLTYEDVTNIDSVGIITARAGVRVNADGSTSSNYMSVGASDDLKIYHDSNSVITNTTGLFTLNNASSDGSVYLQYSGSNRLITDVSGVGITGNVDATGVLSGGDGIRLPLTGGVGITTIEKGQASFTGIVTASAFKLSDGSNVGGVESDSSYNTLGGTDAGASFNTSGNVAQENTLFGYQAGNAVDYGDGNTVFGYQAMLVSTGEHNTVIGWKAADSLGGSSNANVFIGKDAAGGLSGGCNQNIAIGSLALNDGSGLTGNICLGGQAGKEITNNYNVCIGHYAGGSITSLKNGENNIIIGRTASPSAENVSNEITLGNTDITKFRIPGLNITIDSNGISDAKGNLRSIPQQNEQGSTHTLVAADAGKHILADNTVTVPPTSGIFSAGDAITIVNAGSSNISIAKGSGVTLYNSADGSDTGRTLSAKGMATILCAGVNTYYISGAGLS
tara:strand:+ start:254 stop:1726 length:1473 start_codon:yes stop_codon:yes gene_type:complete